MKRFITAAVAALMMVVSSPALVMAENVPSPENNEVKKNSTSIGSTEILVSSNTTFDEGSTGCGAAPEIGFRATSSQPSGVTVVTGTFVQAYELNISCAAKKIIGKDGVFQITVRNDSIKKSDSLVAVHVHDGKQIVVPVTAGNKEATFSFVGNEASPVYLYKDYKAANKPSGNTPEKKEATNTATTIVKSSINFTAIGIGTLIVAVLAAGVTLVLNKKDI